MYMRVNAHTCTHAAVSVVSTVKTSAAAAKGLHERSHLHLLYS
jgi:hypothetical protein